VRLRLDKSLVTESSKLQIVFSSVVEKLIISPVRRNLDKKSIDG